MCRNIRNLRQPGRRVPSHHELEDAALQFVRKISGYRKPSRANQEAFDLAVRQIAEAGRQLFRSLRIHNSRKAA
ncbi:MAG: DUF2277 domain-containing protein [Ignavibacteriales bacterium]|nr:DUF2277 domain-containing protein [Ignavibacteriales bacterium]